MRGVLTVFLCVMSLTTTVLAQAPAAPAAAAPAGAPQVHHKNMFQMFFRAEDVLGQTLIIVLVLMSVVVVSLSIRAVMENRKNVLMPPENITEYEALLDDRKFTDVIEKAATDHTMSGRILHAALSRASQGFGAMERAVEETADVLSSKRIRGLEYLNILGAIGPMVGLFGTVYGMILAFEAMVSAGGQPKPAELAAGVSTALVNTFWGLVVGIPAIVFASVVRNWIDEATVDIMVQMEALLDRFRPAKKSSASSSTEKTAVGAGAGASPKPRPA
jgi:biopolymer transport protein ExbB